MVRFLCFRPDWVSSSSSLAPHETGVSERKARHSRLTWCGTLRLRSAVPTPALPTRMAPLLSGSRWPRMATRRQCGRWCRSAEPTPALPIRMAPLPSEKRPRMATPRRCGRWCRSVSPAPALPKTMAPLLSLSRPRMATRRRCGRWCRSAARTPALLTTMEPLPSGSRPKWPHGDGAGAVAGVRSRRQHCQQEWHYSKANQSGHTGTMQVLVQECGADASTADDDVRDSDWSTKP